MDRSVIHVVNLNAPSPPSRSTQRLLRHCRYRVPVPWQQLLTSLVDSLAWPVVVIAAVLLLRKPLSNALRDRDLKSFSAGPGGITLELWERRLEQTRESIDLAPPVGPKTQRPGEPDDFLEEMLELILDFPEAAVVEAFRRLERLLVVSLGGPYARASQITPEQASRVGPPSLRLLIDVAIGNRFLTDAEGKAVLALRNLRNAAAHGHGIAIEADAAWEYIDSIAQVASKMRDRAETAGTPLPPL